MRLTSIPRTGIAAVQFLRQAARIAAHAVRSGQGRPFLRAIWARAREGAPRVLAEVNQAAVDAAGIHHSAFEQLAAQARGLHALLPSKEDFGYSVLLAANESSPEVLTRTLASCRRLSAPHLEVLVGGSWTELLARARYPHALLIEPRDWLRPDILLRYELVLRNEAEPQSVVMGCRSRRLGSSGEFLPAPPVSGALSLPFAFETESLEGGILVPRSLAASHAAGSRSILELGVAILTHGGRFVHVPLPLRAREPAQAIEPGRTDALRRYYTSQGLDWDVDDASGRVRPRIATWPSLQAIVPFRDQRALTIECIRRLLDQDYPGLHVTAVDNDSTDSTIAGELERSGVQVIRMPGPFNFSHLNNRAAGGSASELLLFLNNDVSLAPGALFELAAWASQTPVGIVGCALFYPDGRLQHGGIEASPWAPREEMGWHDFERGRPRSRLERATHLKVVDAVSAGCAMMRREVFEAVGGFDEIHYPVAFSDTDLALRVRARGLTCVYTPFAEAVHQESASRRYARIEDFEGSSWLAKRLGRTEVSAAQRGQDAWRPLR